MTPDRFTRYVDAAGFAASDILPIIPPGAPIVEGSEAAGKQGKIPGVWQPDKQAWSGMGEWTKRTFRRSALVRWNDWPAANVGLQARCFPAADIDVTDPALADALEEAVGEIAGPTLVRGRGNSAKRLLMYRLADGEPAVSKWAVAFTHPRTGETIHRVELLGAGQQYVIEGLHPSGVPYEWRDGFGAAEVGAAAIPEITFAVLVDLRQAILDAVGMLGGVVKGRAATTLHAAGSGSRRPIGDPSLKARDEGELRRAIEAMPNDLDRESWVAMSAAIKAAAAGAEELYAPYEAWCLKWAGNTPEVARALWESLHDSELGAEFVYNHARAHGFKGGIDEFEALPDEDGTASGMGLGRQRRDRSNTNIVRIVEGELDEMIEEAEEALITADRGIYQHGSTMVRLGVVQAAGSGVRLFEVERAELVEAFTAAVRFVKWDGRSKSWVRKDCPDDVASGYLAKRGRWRLPELAGVITAPTLRADGSLLNRVGYDQATRLLLCPSAGAHVDPAALEAPSRDDALRAVKVLDELIGGFPFVAPMDRAVALSAVLTACIRRSLPTAPLHGFTAPAPGTGKSLLVETVSMLAEGRPAGAMNAGSGSDGELDKRVAAALLQGDLIIAIDNIQQPLKGEQLCSAVSQPMVRIRILGRSHVEELPANALFLANGNNLQIVEDMTRRSVLCRMDARCERPELRHFAVTPPQLIRAERGRYLTAALTILRAHRLAAPRSALPPLGGFEAWSSWVRGALVWLDQGDPCETIERVRIEDPERAAHRTVMQVWAQVFGAKSVTASELLDGGIDDATLARGELLEALVTAVSSRGELNAKRLGRWLSSKEGLIVDGRRITKSFNKTEKIWAWSLQKVE